MTGRRYAVGMVVVVVLLFVGAVVANVGYTQHVAERSDHRWCELFALLDPAGTPPTTDRGRQVQDQILRLRKEFHCGEKR